MRLLQFWSWRIHLFHIDFLISLNLPVAIDKCIFDNFFSYSVYLACLSCCGSYSRWGYMLAQWATLVLSTVYMHLACLSCCGSSSLCRYMLVQWAILSIVYMYLACLSCCGSSSLWGYMLAQWATLSTVYMYLACWSCCRSTSRSGYMLAQWAILSTVYTVCTWPVWAAVGHPLAPGTCWHNGLYPRYRWPPVHWNTPD